jgi:RecJ-like exonuclease
VRKVICISHSADVDGIASAALLKLAKNADIKLVDYDDFIESLKSVSNASELYICDLGLSPETAQPFFEELDRIRRVTRITYIDHHPKVRGFRYASKTNFRIIHSLKDCAAALTYIKFRNILPKGASMIVAFAALTDYLENGPIASKILDLHDRIQLYYEASMLAFAIEWLGRASEKLNTIVDDLSRLRYPHEISGVPEAASQQAKKVSSFLKRVEKEGVVKRGYAYIEVASFPKGAAANLVRCVFGTPVGVAYKIKDNSPYVEISLRASSTYPKDLGSITQRLASEFGGFGGGHSKASGARIPKESLQRFLQALEDML